MGAHVSLEVRASALAEIARGASAAQVARVMGFRPRRVRRWVMLAGMELNSGLTGGAAHVAGEGPPVRGVGHGRRLSIADRAVIQVGLAQGMSMRALATVVGVSASTVSREVARASIRARAGVVYDADVADSRAGSARRRPQSGKLSRPSRLREAVVALLNERYSPTQVTGRLEVLYPDDEDMRVSPETIYQALYVQGRGGLRHELTVAKALRSGRTTRKPQSKLPARKGRPWLEGARLSDRPAEADDRAVPGHWEGDLVVGPGNSGIVTLVERSSRFTLIGRLPGMRDSTTVIDKLSDMIAGLPGALKASITWDQGVEMAFHADFTVKTGCPVFFCDPHSPWQRGTNENTNGLIREFHPKGTNFNTITDADLAETQRLINIRARKVLNFHTPAEKLDEYIQAVALTT